MCHAPHYFLSHSEGHLAPCGDPPRLPRLNIYPSAAPQLSKLSCVRPRPDQKIRPLHQALDAGPSASRAGLLARPVICRLRRDATPAMRAATVTSGAVGRKGIEWLGQPATPVTDLCGVSVRHRPATLALHGRGMGTGAAARNNALHQRRGGHDGRCATDALAEPAIRAVTTGSAVWQPVEDDQVAEVPTAQISGVNHAPSIWLTSTMPITPRSSAYRAQRLMPPSPVCRSPMAASEPVVLRQCGQCAARDVNLLPANINLHRHRHAEPTQACQGLILPVEG